MDITGFWEGKVGSANRLRKGRKFFLQGSAIECGCFISTHGESIAFFSYPPLMGSMVGAFIGHSLGRVAVLHIIY